MEYMMEQGYDIDGQHKKGKLHAIERIHILLDENSFYEIGAQVVNYNYIKEGEGPCYAYDGVITGYGTINKNLVYVYSQDSSINGGTLGLMHGKKISRLIEMAIRKKCPVIGINDSAGARIQEGVNALAGYGEVFYANTLASGYIPQISVIAGDCAGGAVYSPAITDFIFVIRGISRMFVTGPNIVNNVTGQSCTAEELGGSDIHAGKSGVAHFYHCSEEECFKEVRRLVDMLYYSGTAKIITSAEYPYTEKSTGWEGLIPRDFRRTYDMRNLIEGLLDQDIFLEVQKDFAPNLIVGFGRISGIVVGIVANQPAHLAGVLDCDASDKGGRFVRFCDSFHIPLITLVDVPGFMPGIQQEHNGIIRHGAKLLYAYSEATTIKLTLIVRKAYGGAYVAMGSKHLKADFVYAWPDAEVAVMGAESAVPVIYRSALKGLKGPEKENYMRDKIEYYKQRYMNTKDALREGYIDEIIKPSDTRKVLYSNLIALSGKAEQTQINKKHGCIPL